MPKLQFQAIVSSIQSKVDRTLKVTLTTQELGRDAGELMNLSGQQISVLFVGASQPITDDMIPDAPKDISEAKSPSWKMRALLYRLWEANNKPGDNFELYYKVKMETLNNDLAKKLDDLTT